MSAADVHLVCLREVVRDPVSGTFQCEQLATALYCNVVGPTDSGLALLSRYPILSSAQLPVHPSDDGYGAAEALHVVVAAPFGSMDILVVHLTPRSGELRLRQLATIAQYLPEMPERPVAVVGDLNTVGADKSELDILQRAGLCDAGKPVDGIGGATMPSHDPITRLDYIWVGQGLAVQRTELIGTDPDPDGYYASDHLGVLAEVAT